MNPPYWVPGKKLGSVSPAQLNPNTVPADSPSLLASLPICNSGSSGLFGGRSSWLPAGRIQQQAGVSKRLPSVSPAHTLFPPCPHAIYECRHSYMALSKTTYILHHIYELRIASEFSCGVIYLLTLGPISLSVIILANNSAVCVRTWG